MSRFRFDRSFLLFSLRATGASLLAHWIAIQIGFNSPQWAAVTVWVVTQPSRGKTFSKGFYRLLGTLIGALFAVALIYFFKEQPFLFLLVLSLWTAVTTAVATLVQYFRSYGSVLAGFTSALVGLTVFSHPESANAVAEGRVACVLLGILVALAIASFLSESSSKKDFYLKLDELSKQTLHWIRDVMARKSREQLVREERELVSQLSALDELMTYAAAESMQIRRQRNKLQSFIAQLFSTISAARAVGLYYRKLPELTEKTTATREIWIRELAKYNATAPVELPPSATYLANPDLLPLVEGDSLAASEVQSLNDRLSFLRTTLIDLWQQRELIQNNQKGQSGKTLSYHRDYKNARNVGIRSGVAVFLVGLFWLTSHLAIGPLMVIMTAVNVGIFATHHNPKSAIISAFKASILSLVAAFICLHLLSFFPASPVWVYLWLALFLIPGGIFVTHPLYALPGTLYCANFLVFVSPMIPMPAFHLHEFSTLALGFFAALVLSYLVFYFILPTDPLRRGQWMARDIIRDLERMAKAPTDERAFEWETLMYNRIGNLIKILSEVQSVRAELFEGSLAIIDVGQEIIRLRSRLKKTSVSADDKKIIQDVLNQLGLISQKPVEVVEFLMKVQGDESSASIQLRETFKEISDRLRTHMVFLQTPNELLKTIEVHR